jgi:hypothetical protein
VTMQPKSAYSWRALQARDDALHDVVEHRSGVWARHRSFDPLQPLANLLHDGCVLLGQCMCHDRYLLRPFDCLAGRLTRFPAPGWRGLRTQVTHYPRAEGKAA